MLVTTLNLHMNIQDFTYFMGTLKTVINLVIKAYLVIFAKEVPQKQ